MFTLFYIMNECTTHAVLPGLEDHIEQSYQKQEKFTKIKLIKTHVQSVEEMKIQGQIKVLVKDCASKLKVDEEN